jgi:hypothetical protein
MKFKMQTEQKEGSQHRNKWGGYETKTQTHNSHKTLENRDD